jgi:hypothetical protein
MLFFMNKDGWQLQETDNICTYAVRIWYSKNYNGLCTKYDSLKYTVCWFTFKSQMTYSCAFPLHPTSAGNLGQRQEEDTGAKDVNTKIVILCFTGSQ